MVFDYENDVGADPWKLSAKNYAIWQMGNHFYRLMHSVKTKAMPDEIRYIHRDPVENDTVLVRELIHIFQANMTHWDRESFRAYLTLLFPLQEEKSPVFDYEDDVCADPWKLSAKNDAILQLGNRLYSLIRSVKFKATPDAIRYLHRDPVENDTVLLRELILSFQANMTPEDREAFRACLTLLFPPREEKP
jgi:hypothetical protein